MGTSLTLLLTDMVDSTRLNESLGDAAMAALWNAHDAASRSLANTWRGQEVGRTDGFLLLFESADDAIGFAESYHRAVHALETRLKARVGVHLGLVTLRENSEVDRSRGALAFEVDGIALPVVARVAAAAQGGQTLLTASVVHALTARPTSLRPCGHWQMKGVAEPIELFEISANATLEPLADSVKVYRVVKTSRGWEPARQIANNLPADRDTFVGRGEALHQIARLFDGRARLVTLLGIGGIGKTRLALRYASVWLGDYPRGAWFCDLSTSRGPDGIVYAVAQSLDIALGKSDPVQQIAVAIAGRGACLIVLDNFEQVATHAEATLGVWLAHAPEAKFIVTSREVLGIRGEHTMVLSPLDAAEGAELFMRRADEVAQRFQLGPEDHAAIAPLVRLLDGLPLAIELAAARSRIMTPAMLLERMHERFTLLAVRGGRLDRQLTLRAALDWSWDLLAEPEKTALAQLSVFEGGFTLAAAEAVVDLSGIANSMLAVDVLQSLIDKSLVRQASGARFDLLVSVQEYAADRLRNMPRPNEQLAATMAAELRHFAHYAEYRGQDIANFAIRELDNLVAASKRAVVRGAGDDATVALESAWAALKLRGPINVAIDMALAIRKSGALSANASARLHRITGSALFALGHRDQAQQQFEEGLKLVSRFDDPLLEGQLLCSLGDLLGNAGRMADAANCFSSAHAIAKRLRNPDFECAVLNSLGSHHDSLGQIDIALEHYKVALATARAAGIRGWEAGALGNLGELHATKGQHRQAERLFEEAIAVARVVGDRRWEGNGLCNLAITCHELGKFREAREHLDAALAIASQLGQRRLEAVTLCNLGIVAESMGEQAQARGAFERAIAVARELRDRRSEGQFLTYLGLLHGRTGDYGSARACLSSAESLLQAVSDSLSLGLSLSARAEVEHLAGEKTLSNEMLARAEDLALSLNPGPQSEFGVALARARQLTT